MVSHITVNFFKSSSKSFDEYNYFSLDDTYQGIGISYSFEEIFAVFILELKSLNAMAEHPPYLQRGTLSHLLVCKQLKQSE